MNGSLESLEVGSLLAGERKRYDSDDFVVPEHFAMAVHVCLLL